MYEYKVVPAPRRGLKSKGLKTNEARFANALQTVMNELSKDGWRYLRTDTLPSEEREGIMGRTTVFQNMLVFYRQLEDGEQPSPLVALEAPTQEEIEEPEFEEPQNNDVDVDEAVDKDQIDAVSHRHND